jgi:hypothetical protein
MADQPQDQSRGSHIMSAADFAAMQAREAREWSEWRGRMTGLLEMVCEKIDRHVDEDRGSFREIFALIHTSNDGHNARFAEVWDGINLVERRANARVAKVEKRVTWFGGGGSGIVFIMNLIIGGLAAYAAFK